MYGHPTHECFLCVAIPLMSPPVCVAIFVQVALSKPPKGAGQLVVSVDLLGASLQQAPPLSLQPGTAAKLHFDAAFNLKSGSKERAAVVKVCVAIPLMSSSYGLPSHS